MAPDFLVIRLSAIGDALLVTPIFQAILDRYPDARIHLITGQNNLPLFEEEPRLFKVYGFNKNQSQDLYAQLPEVFFHISDLQNNRHSRKIRQKLQGPVKVLQKQNLRKWFMVRGMKGLKPCSHVVQRYVETLPWTVTPSHYPLQLSSSLPSDTLSFLLPETLQQKSFIACAIGSAHATKAIPPDLVKALLPKLPFPVLLLGTPTELNAYKDLISMFPNQLFSPNRSTTLPDMAALIQRSTFVITGDTAAMHLAASFQKPMHVVWGNTTPAFGMGPWQVPEAPYPVVHHQVEQLSCRPCSKLGFAQCPRGHFRCMRQNPVVQFDFRTWVSSLNATT